MGRLTVKTSEAMANAGIKYLSRQYGGDIFEILNKLGELEDLEEQGLLLKLPCKVGDTFWELNTTHEVPIIYPRKAHTLQHCNYVADGLGVRAFLSQEEAEAALARLEKQ